MIRSLHFLAFLLLLSAAKSQHSEVLIPQHADRNSELVGLLESGTVNINYTEVRENFIESPQFVAAAKQRRQLDSLRKAISSYMDKLAYDDVIRTGKAILSIDYTDIMAHRILSQTYERTGDSLLQARYGAIGSGLMRSILDNGDGLSFKTAWHDIQVHEDYVILGKLKASLLRQSLDHKKKRPYEAMEVSTEQGKKTYYFDVTRDFEGYVKLMVSGH